MPDCAADSRIISWARTYTRDPRHFEAVLRDVMPRLAYVQQVAARHDIPGEFVLLPWVESHYQPLGSRYPQRPAGMWQIVPSTARGMGLHVGRDYDARYNVPAATEGVMVLLQRYYRDLHDWRLVDYAYNFGEFGVRQLVQRYGMPPAEPAIPGLPVPRHTKDHLAKLLAIACVVREPGRFGVTLPLPDPQDALVAVTVNHAMPLDAAARRAGMPLSRLKHLNAAFRDGRIPADQTPLSLLLPKPHAEQWRQSSSASAAPEEVASAATGSPALPPQRDKAPAPHPDRLRHHTVRRGESLWSIARRYGVSVRELERWNHLRSHEIKPGQLLVVGATH